MIKTLRLAALCAALSCSVLLLSVAAASASTIKPVKVAATLNPDDGSYEATAICPAGRRVVSGGFASPDPVSPAINRADGNGWTVKAFDTETVSAIAYCSKYIKGITTTTATGPLDQLSTNPNSGPQQGGATASCPSGSKVIAGGWEYTNKLNNSSVYSSRPVGSTDWKIYAASDQAGNSITTYAYCLAGKTFKTRAGEKIPTQSSTRTAARGTAGRHRGGVSETPTATAKCKQDETAFGGGFETTPTPDFYNDAGPDTFFYKSARFDGNGWKAKAVDYSDFSEGAIQTFVICRKPGT